VERSLWDATQAILDQNPRVRGNTTRARVPFLLKGIVQGVDGRALTLWFTRKKSGRLYRYYLPVRDNKEHAGASGLPRLLSAELEAAVLRAAAPAAVCPGDGRQCGRACPSENWWMN
jgi:site-specific DNA recombinase